MADVVKPAPAPLEEAFSHSARLEGFLRRRGHGDESRDLVQDLFIVLLSKGDGLVCEEPGRFRSFLFAIAYRLGANATRRRRRDPDGAERPADRLASSAPSPERTILLKENVRRAAAALDALPPEMRTALVLIADEGRSTKDVAELTGVSEEVVRSRLSRGRKRLASILEGRKDP
ncbi:MAG: RNA polymerase sigma factor [Thermoanaerobaculia bacterium]|nr:RNA polymerase sigma factor [Thermoanaerobaculia bacterium]